MNRIIRIDEARMAKPITDPELPEAEQSEAAPEAQNENGGEVQIDPTHVRIVEALLFAASEPLTEQALAAALPAGTAVAPVVAELYQF